MKILLTADTHIGASYPYAKRDSKGYTNRQLDIFNIFNEVVFGKLKDKWDIFIHAGDFFDSFYLDGEALFIAASILWLFEKNKTPAFFLKGNHDDDRISALSSYVNFPLKYCKFVLQTRNIPLIHNIKDLALVTFIPYDTMDKVTADIDKAIVRLKAKPSAISNIIVGHFAVKNTEYSGTVCRYGISPEKIANLLHIGFCGVFLGHHHKRQFIPGTEKALYVGSPFQKDFGEVNEPHGLTIFDTKTNEIQYYNSGAPTFCEVTIDSLHEQVPRLRNSNLIIRLTFEGPAALDRNFIKDTKLKFQQAGAIHVVVRIKTNRQKRTANAVAIDAAFTPEKMSSIYIDKMAPKGIDKANLKEKSVKIFSEIKQEGLW